MQRKRSPLSCGCKCTYGKQNSRIFSTFLKIHIFKHSHQLNNIMYSASSSNRSPTSLSVPDERGEVWLARLTDVDRDVSNLLRGIEEREL